MVVVAHLVNEKIEKKYGVKQPKNKTFNKHIVKKNDNRENHEKGRM
jgi:hypothetical protein